jgi:hypothetical protein
MKFKLPEFNTSGGILLFLAILLGILLVLLLVLVPAPTDTLNTTNKKLISTQAEIQDSYEELIMLYYYQAYDMGYENGLLKNEDQIFYGIHLSKKLLAYYEKYGDRHFKREFMKKLRNYK